MEIKVPVFKRLPPGDRWVDEALEYYFQKTGTRQYYIDAAEGVLYIVQNVEDPVVPPKQFSIYGDY
jgi:hypothetical protein